MSDGVTTLRSCLPSTTPPHTGHVDDWRRSMPISARSEHALHACAVEVLEYHAQAESAEENEADA